MLSKKKKIFFNFFFLEIQNFFSYGQKFGIPNKINKKKIIIRKIGISVKISHNFVLRLTLLYPFNLLLQDVTTAGCAQITYHHVIKGMSHMLATFNFDFSV